jgi:hypothetical protein
MTPILRKAGETKLKLASRRESCVTAIGEFHTTTNNPNLTEATPEKDKILRQARQKMHRCGQILTKIDKAYNEIDSCCVKTHANQLYLDERREVLTQILSHDPGTPVSGPPASNVDAANENSLSSSWMRYLV